MMAGILLLMLILVLIGCGKTAAAAPAVDYQAENAFMQMAIEEARQGIYTGDGGPFASVIVKDGKVVGSGHNHVLAHNDPTCHGEVDAIRKTCEALKTYDLSGCILYTTGEPCPMCLCACMWANIDRVYYGATIADNAEIGFRDERFDDLMGGREKLADYLVCIDREACLELFAEYNALENHVVYWMERMSLLPKAAVTKGCMHWDRSPI